MKTVGIVCECNPLHGGHLYLMEQARTLRGAEAVICVMSGCFTQRGEAAVFDPRTRGRMLLASGGADAVFELPFPYSAAGAEFFAAAGVSLLDRLGADEILFGSECGELAPLQRAAELSLTPTFQEAYRESCRGGALGTAEGYLSLLQEMGGMTGALSNDILGISYLKAMLERKSGMSAFTVKREGSGFRETELREGGFPSASALREAMRREGVAALRGYLPPRAFSSAEEAWKAQNAPADLKRAERGILSFFRLTSPALLDSVPELSGGLGRRMAEAANHAASLEELIAGSVTKKYTEARVRRGILFAMMGVTREDLRREPAYAVLLAANAVGCRFLSEGKKTRRIPVVTCHGDLPKSNEAHRQQELTRRAFALYSLALPNAKGTDHLLRCSSYIEDGKSEGLHS